MSSVLVPGGPDDREYQTFDASDRVGPAVQALAALGTGDAVILLRGKTKVPVRRLYGLPSSANGRKLVSDTLTDLEMLRELVAEDLSSLTPRPVWHHKLRAIETQLGEQLDLIRSVVGEDAAMMHVSPGFQSIVHVHQTWLNHLKEGMLELQSPSCGIFSANSLRRHIQKEGRKATGLTDLLRLAVEIHQAVDVHGHLSPFPNETELASAPTLANWTHFASLFDPAPFFALPGTHTSPRLTLFNRLIIHATAAAARSFTYKSAFMKAISFGFWNVIYTFNYGAAAKKTAEYLSDSKFDFQLVKFLWNLPESPGIKSMFSVMVHSIHMDKLFSIPATPEVPNSAFYSDPSCPPRLVDPGLVMRDLPADYASNHPFVRARLVSSGYLPFSGDERPFLDTRIFVKNDAVSMAAEERLVGGLYGDFTLRYPLLPEPCPALIIHVHGGGFVAMTSFSHTAYMRKWALDTGIPVMSIDYRLAPEYAYPVQLEECWQAYRWAVKNAMRVGSLAERIILIGDSAGGNLVAGLTLRAMAEGFRRPDMVIMAYPALVIAKEPSCARLLSTIDPMLNVNMLLNILNMYYTVGNADAKDAYMSPAFASDEALAQFPTTRLLLGQFDPLLDDSVLFARRLEKVNHPDTIVSVRPGLGHGFLNLLDISPEANEAVALVSVWILEQMTAWGYRSAVLSSRKSHMNLPAAQLVTEIPVETNHHERTPLKRINS